MLLNQPTRLVLTIFGMSLCIGLIIFLFGIYKGVADGSVDYVRKNKVDLWIIQKSSTNILRGTSILSSNIEKSILKNSEIKNVTPILLLLTTAKTKNNFATLFIAGYPLKSKYGGPPEIYSGRDVENNDELVLDKAFAAKMNLIIGDTVKVQDKSLRIVGLCTGTNAFVIQYGFTTLDCAQSLLGFRGLVTCYMIKLHENSDKQNILQNLQNSLRGVSVYDYDTFLQNNIRETESGILPIFYSVAGIGGVVLTIILSLILSINILEKKDDFALMKALGAPKRFLPKLIIYQSLTISFISVLLAIGLIFPMTNIIELLSPEVSPKTTVDQLIIVACLVCIMSMISSFISIRRLKNIFPLEVFQ
jgi:putative ABC transport system permease protein